MSAQKTECLKGLQSTILVSLLVRFRQENVMYIYLFTFTDTVTVLINAAGDNDNSVNNVVIKSLTKIANAYPNDVIEIFCEYYKNTAKANPLQLGNIVKWVYFQLLDLR